MLSGCPPPPLLPLKENSIGEQVNNFGKEESFMKLMEILATEEAEEVGLEVKVLLFFGVTLVRRVDDSRVR